MLKPLAILSCALFSLSVTSETITCQDADGMLTMQANQDADTLSFTFSQNGEVKLSGDLAQDMPAGAVPHVSIFREILADGHRYFDLMASTQQSVWVEESMHSIVTRAGTVFEYQVPAHYENRVLKWFNAMLKETEGKFFFYRIEGNDFGFTTEYPIAQGTECRVEQ